MPFQIVPPYQQFWDRNGDPLESGYIYIGTANLDAQTNQITAYWDAACTIVASQPIRTVNGYPAYNGSPANIYINAASCSIKVLDKNNTFILFQPLFMGTTTAGDVSFLPAGTGAVARTVQNKLREFVSVKDFGAVGDGVTDDYMAFFNAINANPLATAIRVYVPEGYTYKISKTLYLTRPVELFSAGDMENPGAILNFLGATIEGNATYKAAIWIVHVSSLSGANALNLPAGQVGTYGAGSVISGLSIQNSSENGVIINAPAKIYSAQAIKNNKHGFAIIANATGISGNANHSYISHCKSSSNKLSGFYIKGADANTFTISACMAISNKEYGFNDASLLGGVFVGCETQANNIAAYNQQGTTADNSGLGITSSRSVFIGCYCENDQPIKYSLNSRSIIIGATGALPEENQNYFGGVVDKGFLSKVPINIADTDDIAYNQSGGDFARLGKGILNLGWNGKDDKLEIKRSSDYVGYYLNSAYGPAFLVRITSDFNNTIKRGRMYIMNGFALSTNHAQTAGAAAPTTGNYERGNIVWNNSPSAGGNVGWVCVASGTPGTWKSFGVIDS